MEEDIPPPTMLGTIGCGALVLLASAAAVYDLINGSWRLLRWVASFW